MDGKLGVIEFGRQLIETGDLDPVYLALWKSELPPDKLKKWLLAYFCFYHCGTASWIADAPDYWRAMEAAAASSKYPRGTERRHYRGEAAIKSVNWLRQFGIESLFDPLINATATPNGLIKQPVQLRKVMDYVRTWREFGLWIAFKVADMMERLDLCAVRFDDADCFLFDSPKEAVSLVAQIENVEPNPAMVMSWIQGKLSDLKSPPRYERPINAQEVETILCKWKSHLGGHYHIGKDIHEIRAGLLRFPTIPTAQLLLRNLPPVPASLSVV